MIFVDVSPTLPAIPVAICWLLITEWASRPEHRVVGEKGMAGDP